MSEISWTAFMDPFAFPSGHKSRNQSGYHTQSSGKSFNCYLVFLHTHGWKNTLFPFQKVRPEHYRHLLRSSLFNIRPSVFSIEVRISNIELQNLKSRIWLLLSVFCPLISELACNLIYQIGTFSWRSNFLYWLRVYITPLWGLMAGDRLFL